MQDDLIELAEMDDWLRKRCEALSDEMWPFLMAGGDLNDPDYRRKLGEHNGYMHVRSYISGSRRALQPVSYTRRRW